MAEFGTITLLASFLLALYVIVVALVGARRRQADLVESAQHGVYAVAALVSLASLALLYAFVSHDYSLKYVFDHSSREMPPELIVAAFYSGHQGSLLYWAWTLALLSAVVVFQNRHQHRPLMPYVMAVLMGIEAFFGLLLVFVTSPFVKLPTTPVNGLGLNPLLYDSGMLIHPPMLLAGYMSWSVPFAFAIAALATGRLSAEWIAATRRYALLAWTILGAGNLLGAWWAYHVLGWGGYWGWDPVENAAIMPWLTGTAYLHSVMIQERRGMLKLWNPGLLVATFCLCIFGTFVVRSGVISSVHAFAQSLVGPYYLAFLAAVVLLSVALLAWRSQYLSEEHALDSMLSREAAFLLNNLLFIGLVFAIFWGSIFPLITEVIQGAKLTVGPPYFNQVAGPILLMLVALMGVGPLMPWRRSTFHHLQRVFLPPVAVGAAVAAVLAVAGIREPVALLSFGVFGFVLATVTSEFVRGTQARHAATGEGYPRALLSLVERNNRRYGGYVIHLGIVAIAVAAVASNFFQVERQASLRPGETMAVGDYRLTYSGLNERQEPGVRVVEALVAVSQGGRAIETIRPSKRYHDNFERQPQSGIVIRTTPVEDLYVVLVGSDDQGSASLLVFVNPMVWWLWMGGVLLLLGAWVTVWPQPRLDLAAAPGPVRGVPVGA